MKEHHRFFTPVRDFTVYISRIREWEKLRMWQDLFGQLGGGRGVPQILQPWRMHPRRGTQDFPHAVLLNRRNSREGKGAHSFLKKVHIFTFLIVHVLVLVLVYSFFQTYNFVYCRRTLLIFLI